MEVQKFKGTRKTHPAACETEASKEEEKRNHGNGFRRGHCRRLYREKEE